MGGSNGVGPLGWKNVLGFGLGAAEVAHFACDELSHDDSVFSANVFLTTTEQPQIEARELAEPVAVHAMSE